MFNHSHRKMILNLKLFFGTDKKQQNCQKLDTVKSHAFLLLINILWRAAGATEPTQEELLYKHADRWQY